MKEIMLGLSTLIYIIVSAMEGFTVLEGLGCVLWAWLMLYTLCVIDSFPRDDQV